MDTNNLLISVISSVSVTTILAFVFKTLFKSSLDHHFKTQLEKYKSHLDVIVDSEQKKATRRMEAYPQLVEQVYRSRNIARDLSIHFTPTNYSLFEEFISRANQLEDCLYKYRIDLERDNLFVEVHQFKNILKTFCMKLSDIKYFIEHKEEERIMNLKKELVGIYALIEEKHTPLIHNLALFQGENKE